MSRWAESARRTVSASIRWARHDDGVLVIGLFVGTILVNGILAIV